MEGIKITSAELSVWIDRNIPKAYDDLSDVDELIDKWVQTAKSKSIDNRWVSFEAAMRKGFRDSYLDPIAGVYDNIEAADVISELPKEDVESIGPLFRRELREGLNQKENELNSVWLEALSGEIFDSDSDKELNNVIKTGVKIDLSANAIANLKSAAAERREELIEDSGLNVIIDRLNRATTVDAIDDAIGDSPGTGATRKRYGKEAGEKLSWAITEAAHRKFELQHPE